MATTQAVRQLQLQLSEDELQQALSNSEMQEILHNAGIDLGSRKLGDFIEIADLRRAIVERLFMWQSVNRSIKS